MITTACDLPSQAGAHTPRPVVRLGGLLAGMRTTFGRLPAPGALTRTVSGTRVDGAARIPTAEAIPLVLMTMTATRTHTSLVSSPASVHREETCIICQADDAYPNSEIPSLRGAGRGFRKDQGLGWERQMGYAPSLYMFHGSRVHSARPLTLHSSLNLRSVRGHRRYTPGFSRPHVSDIADG